MAKHTETPDFAFFYQPRDNSLEFMTFISRNTIRYFFLIFLLVQCVGILQGIAQTRPTSEEVSIEKKLIEGKKYVLLGDWEKAEALFLAILQEDVLNSAACYELSRTYTAKGNYQEALTYIHKAIRIEPDNEWYLLMEADIQEKAGDIAATMDMYEQLISLRPSQPHYYEMLISLCKKTGQDDRMLLVLEQYEQVIGITESIARTKFETLDRLDRPDEAAETLHELTVVYPTNIDYKFLAASYARKRGRDAEANQYYKDVLSIYPENSRAKLALASTEKEEGDDAGYLKSIVPVISNADIDIDVKLKELIPYVVTLSETKDTALGHALVSLTKFLVNAHPTDAKSYAISGDVQAIVGNTTEAITAYQKSTSLNGSVYAVWEQMLSLLMRHRDYHELVRQSELAMVNFPNQAYLYYTAGYGLYKTDEFDESLEYLNEALVMSGRNTGQKISVLNVLGLVYDEQGELEKSATAFETALSYDPRSAETMAYYSHALSGRITQSEKALSMTQDVLKQQGLSPQVHEVLAQVLYNQKKYAEAQVSIDQVLTVDPHGDAYNLAGDILLKQGKNADALAMWEMALETGCTDSGLKSKMAAAKAQ